MSLIFSIIFLAAHANSQTIAQLIADRKSTMSRADAAIASNPEWSQAGAHTLFVSTDAGLQNSGLPDNSLGSILVGQSIDFLNTPNYQILRDIKSSNIMVYDNYRGGQPVPEIHCRFGTGEAMAVQQIRADNGWLYILDKPILPPGPADAAIRSIGIAHGSGTSRFLALLQSMGLTSYLNSLKDVTMWIPVDAAMNSFDSSKYTPDQLRSIVLYHVTPNVQYSTGFNAGSIPTALQGQTINIAVGQDALTINGNSRVVVADTFSTSGVIHTISQVLVPNALPEVTLPSPVVSIPAPSTNTSQTGGSQTSVSPKTSASPPSQPETNDALAKTGTMIKSAFGFLAYFLL